MDYKILDFYKEQGFDLVPILANSKVPIEQKWTEKVHTDPIEWKRWIDNGLNLGVKCGKCSNIVIIDVDQKPTPPELQVILDKYPTLTQNTSKGVHFIYRFTDKLPKTRIEGLKVDIETTGGQCVIYPSIIDGFQRELIIDDIAEFPEELLTYLQSKITTPALKTNSEQLSEDINSEDFNLGVIEEGNRNGSLIRLGGILRKELNLTQVGFALNIVNRLYCKPPLPLRELDTVIGSLEKYVTFSETDLALKILNWLKIVEEASSRDIKEGLGETSTSAKQRVDKALKYLIKEGFVFKKRREFHLIKKAEWKTELIDVGKKINFIMPYFEDRAIFRDGDMLIIGAKPGFGKTHVAINIVKQLSEQGIIPNYISLESGARFIDVALTLNLKQGDFKWSIHFSPQDIELEENAVTIIDWLLPDDYANTDKLYKYFAEQLVKKNGILIVFVQLMQNGNFFAANMIDMFPAFACKFLYEDETGVNSFFQITKIREQKEKTKYGKILTYYDWQTKELKVRNA
jgi:hypothetical protein